MVKTGVSINKFIEDLNKDFDSKQNTLTAESGISISEDNKISIRIGSGLQLDSKGNLQNTLVNGVEWNYYEYTLSEATNKVEFDLPVACTDKLGLYIFQDGTIAIPLNLIELTNSGYTVTVNSDKSFDANTKFECRWTSYLSIQPQMFLFSTIRSDYAVEDVSWLRSDTFSWHSGDLYQKAYNHLADEYKAATNELSDSYGEITIKYKKAEDGHKICLSDQEDNLKALFEQEGVAWYYMIDLDGLKFKLPRSKYNFKGISTGIGDLTDLDSVTAGSGKDVQSYLYFFMGRYEDQDTKSSSDKSRNVGDIFYTSRLDTNLNGAVEANGGIYNVADFAEEQSVPALLKLEKLPYVSLDEYETLLTSQESVGVFGWDGESATTFRVPKLNNVYLTSSDSNGVGDFIAESLPNITGSLVSNSYSAIRHVATQSGALYMSSAKAGLVGENIASGADVYLDASRSSSTYQDDAKVKPNSICYRAMVQLASGTNDTALETCTSVLADVADLKGASNISSTGKETIVGWGIPDYSRTIDVTSTLYTNKEYTAPLDGILYNAMLPAANTQILINGIVIGTRTYSVYGNWIPTPYPMSKGDVFSVAAWYTTNSTGGAYFVPFKGVN